MVRINPVPKHQKMKVYRGHVGEAQDILNFQLLAKSRTCGALPTTAPT